MNYLLDTSVVSEWVKPHPDAGVVRWLHEVDEDRVFLTVMTFAEIRDGVERLPAGRRRTRLDSWVTEELPARFEERVLPVDRSVTDAWGVLTARSRRAGRPVGAVDGPVAATAHGLTVVTRNVADFAAVEVDLVDPWIG